MISEGDPVGVFGAARQIAIAGLLPEGFFGGGPVVLTAATSGAIDLLSAHATRLTAHLHLLDYLFGWVVTLHGANVDFLVTLVVFLLLLEVLDVGLEIDAAATV